MNEIFGIVSMVLAVTGVLLNNRKLVGCFYVWMVSNSLSAYLHFDSHIYSLLIRDVVFTILAFEGLYRWKKVK